MVVDLSFCFCSRSKIWSVRDWALRAMTWRDQCIIALSALIGRRMTLLPFLRSTMRTSGDAASSFLSRRQMKESDSRVCRAGGTRVSRGQADHRTGRAGDWKGRHAARWGDGMGHGARTQELKVMAVWLTPRLLSCSSSWNLMGRAGAMVNLERSAARGYRGAAANLSKVAGRWRIGGEGWVEVGDGG